MKEKVSGKFVREYFPAFDKFKLKASNGVRLKDLRSYSQAYFDAAIRCGGYKPVSYTERYAKSEYARFAKQIDRAVAFQISTWCKRLDREVCVDRHERTSTSFYTPGRSCIDASSPLDCEENEKLVLLENGAFLRILNGNVADVVPDDFVTAMYERVDPKLNDGEPRGFAVDPFGDSGLRYDFLADVVITPCDLAKTLDCSKVLARLVSDVAIAMTYAVDERVKELEDIYSAYKKGHENLLTSMKYAGDYFGDIFFDKVKKSFTLGIEHRIAEKSMWSAVGIDLKEPTDREKECDPEESARRISDNREQESIFKHNQGVVCQWFKQYYEVPDDLTFRFSRPFDVANELISLKERIVELIAAISRDYPADWF